MKEHHFKNLNRANLNAHHHRLCSEEVTKLFPKGFDKQNSSFLHPHGKRKPAFKLHLSALNFESSRAIFSLRVAA